MKFFFLLDNELMIVFTFKIWKPKILRVDNLLSRRTRSRLILCKEWMFKCISSINAFLGVHRKELINKIG